jgi:hypothetical protein
VGGSHPQNAEKAAPNIATAISMPGILSTVDRVREGERSWWRPNASFLENSEIPVAGRSHFRPVAPHTLEDSGK